MPAAGEQGAHGDGLAEGHRGVSAAPQPSGRGAEGVEDHAGRDDPEEPQRPPELLRYRGRVLAPALLGEERFVLEDAVVVDPDGNEEELAIESGVERELEEPVEEAHLGGPQSAVAGEPSLGKDALRDPVPGDELEIAAQHRMVERIGKPAPDEEAAEGAEERVEREDARPLTDRVADGDALREGPADHHVI